jgi:NAD(P)H-dependent FMN reductase
MPTCIQVLTCSTRPGRVGPKVASWLADAARATGLADIEAVDLADFALPVFDEPHHPRLAKYEHAHTKRWSETVARADAFVFVLPEYNHGAPPSIINAMNYLHREWQYKPLGCVGYGGISGGIRSMLTIKQLAVAMRMVPVFESIPIPLVTKQLGPDGFTPNAAQTDAVAPLLRELVRVADALKVLR